MPKIAGSLTDKERDALAPEPLAYLKDAERRVRTAASLFDVGIARGLLLALVKKGAITESQYDRMFKRAYALIKPRLREEVDSIPSVRAAAGVLAPAAPRTRRRRRAETEEE